VTGDRIIAIDQGTTSTRATAFDVRLRPLARSSRQLAVRYPQPGWVEQDAAEILSSVIDVSREVIEATGGPAGIAAVGLDNQGETVVAWDAESGEALAPAVVWQCRRSEPIVAELAAAGHGEWVREMTGLPLDPYFSAGKLTWLLRNVPAVRAAGDRGTLRLGTVDAWVSWHLAGASLTDPSTASRTQLFDLRELRWAPRLTDLFEIPSGALPTLVPTAGELGEWRHPAWPDHPLPLRSMVCDQQAALAGNSCFEPGRTKATYGTGVFVLAAIGPQPATVDRLLTTVAWQIDAPSQVLGYALDGGVFSAGSLLGWLEQLGLSAPAETETLARSVSDTAGVQLLPALAGLGAPWWRPEARGVIAGLTGAATRAHIARAALDAIAHRVADIVDEIDGAAPLDELRVDGGLTANRYLLQRQADLIGRPVAISVQEEGTVLGTAGLAAMASRLADRSTIAEANPVREVFQPHLPPAERARERARWREFVDIAAALAGRDSESALTPSGKEA
jgi:glycerol kinase